MASSMVWASVDTSVTKLKSPSAFRVPSLPSKKLQQVVVVVGFRNNRVEDVAAASIRKVQVVSLAASAAFLLCSSSVFAANAGFLSGFSGIESVPGPELPQIDFLSRWNEENQKYAEADAKFKEFPLLKK